MINRLDYALGNGNRPYQYKVSIQPPLAMVSALMIDSDKLDALCKRVQVPDMQMEQVPIHIHGREVKVPFSTTYSSESVIGFYVDDDFYMRHILEYWMLSLDCYKVLNDNSFIDDLVPTNMLDKLKSLGTQVINKAVSELKAFALIEASILANNIGFDQTKAYIDNYMEGFKREPEKSKYGTVSITPLTYNGEDICTYVLYNVYPMNLGTMQYANDSVGAISEFDCTFYYSHYTIERGSSILGTAVGEAGSKILTKLKSITGF